METMQYKNFLGSIEISKEDKVLYGKLLHINGLITYEAENYPDLEKAFHDAVDDYLADCQERGVEPQKTCSGNFNLRIQSSKHKQLVFLASLSGKSLNSVMNDAVDLVIEKYTAEHTKSLARTVFEFNWDNNENFRNNLTQWTLQRYKTIHTKTQGEKSL